MMLYLLALGTSMERSVLSAVMVLWACEHTLELKMSDLDKDDQSLHLLLVVLLHVIKPAFHLIGIKVSPGYHI